MGYFAHSVHQENFTDFDTCQRSLGTCLCSFQFGALKWSVVDLQTERVLISFRALRCRLRYAQVQIYIGACRRTHTKKNGVYLSIPWSKQVHQLIKTFHLKITRSVSTFSCNFGQQLPVICAWLEVRHGLSTIAFDCSLVISPEFCSEKKREKNRVGTQPLGNQKTREKTLFFFASNGESKMNNLAASTSLSNSPRYMYLHPSMVFQPMRTLEFPIHLPFFSLLLFLLLKQPLS